MTELMLNREWFNARKRLITKREWESIPEEYKLIQDGDHWVRVNDHGATCLLKIQPPVDELPFSIKFHMQRIDWSWDKLGRMYHAYDILMVKFDRVKDIGDVTRIRKALERVKLLEREIKAAEEASDTRRSKGWRGYIEPTGEVSSLVVAEYLDMRHEDVLAYANENHGARFVGGTSRYLIWKEDAEALERGGTVTGLRDINAAVIRKYDK